MYLVMYTIFCNLMIWKKFYLFSWPVIWIISFLWPRDLFMSSFSIKRYVPESLLSFFTYLWSCFTVRRNLSAADFFQCFQTVWCPLHILLPWDLFREKQKLFEESLFSVSWGNKDMEFNLPFTQKTVSWTAHPATTAMSPSTKYTL